MAKGDKVLLKGFRNRPYLGHVWEERQGYILVCSEQDLLAEESGRNPVTPGVAQNCCFKYDAELFIQLQAVYQNSAEEGSLNKLWEKAALY